MPRLVAGIDEAIRCADFDVRLGLSDKMRVEGLFLDGVARAEGHGAGTEQERQGRHCDSRQAAEDASHGQDGKILARRGCPVKAGRGLHGRYQWGFGPWIPTKPLLAAA